MGDEYTTIDSSTSVMIKRRLPWLMIGVLGGTVTASIISVFERVLINLTVLAAFAPVLAYLSDAAGTQSESLTVRSLVLKPRLSRKAYFLREFLVANSLASVCGLMLSIVALVGWQNRLLGIIVGVSMFLGMNVAIVISSSLPFIFKKLNLDPAFASGPFATMVSDVATITIYFLIASLFLAYFPFL